ncbi:hypothetical protein B0H12DRAFT_578980 [Mycena haematopus]|nr:hypothetical protein B0H12DRAFT_578980 [Mycena haematopus]
MLTSRPVLQTVIAVQTVNATRMTGIYGSRLRVTPIAHASRSTAHGTVLPATTANVSAHDAQMTDAPTATIFATATDRRRRPHAGSIAATTTPRRHILTAATCSTPWTVRPQTRTGKACPIRIVTTGPTPGRLLLLHSRTGIILTHTVLVCGLPSRQSRPPPRHARVGADAHDAEKRTAAAVVAEVASAGPPRQPNTIILTTSVLLQAPSPRIRRIRLLANSTPSDRRLRPRRGGELSATGNEDGIASIAIRRATEVTRSVNMNVTSEVYRDRRKYKGRTARDKDKGNARSATASQGTVIAVRTHRVGKKSANANVNDETAANASRVGHAMGRCP